MRLFLSPLNSFSSSRSEHNLYWSAWSAESTASKVSVSLWTIEHAWARGEGKEGREGETRIQEHGTSTDWANQVKERARSKSDFRSESMELDGLYTRLNTFTGA